MGRSKIKLLNALLNKQFIRRFFWKDILLAQLEMVVMEFHRVRADPVLAALLCGENLLLAGGKATGKNVLAENLAAAFGRPAWDISFHVNMDAASLIGMDTFADGQVVFRPGPVYRCAQCGGFGVLDEINMAKNEALAVLHAVLDFRRAIDVPGYDRIPLAEETRFTWIISDSAVD